VEIKIHGRPRLALPLTLAHIDALIALSASHPDGACRAAGKHTGFLYGWRSQALFWKSSRRETIGASPHKLSVCLKILEMAVYINDDSEHMPVIREMRKSFAGAIDMASRASEHWRTTYIG
jgi:hypothetical protein